MIQNKWLLFTFKEPPFNLYKIRLFLPTCMHKSACQMYTVHFHNPKTKQAHKWIIVYMFYVNIFDTPLNKFNCYLERCNKLGTNFFDLGK